MTNTVTIRYGDGSTTIKTGVETIAALVVSRVISELNLDTVVDVTLDDPYVIGVAKIRFVAGKALSR